MRLFDFGSRSIKQKQILILMLTSSMALFLASAGFVVFELLSVRQDMEQKLSTLANYIGSGASSAFEFTDHEAAQKQLMSVVNEEQNHIVSCLYLYQGRQ